MILARQASSSATPIAKTIPFLLFPGSARSVRGSCSQSRPSTTTTAQIIKAPCRIFPVPPRKTAAQNTKVGKPHFPGSRAAATFALAFTASLNKTANFLACSVTTRRSARTSIPKDIALMDRSRRSTGRSNSKQHRGSPNALFRGHG